MRILAIGILITFWLVPRPGSCFPEFQAFSEKSSGRSVNCAMCHANDNGPNGNDDGQLGNLKDGQMEMVNRARSALEPGQEVNSPILNKFGNHIVKTLGMKQVLQLRQNPAGLIEALGTQSDLDGDGISDAREYALGTDPLNKFHGDPWLLFCNNISRFRVDIGLAAASIAFIVFGLANFVKWLHLVSNRKIS